jgi:hypothetical protein
VVEAASGEAILKLYAALKVWGDNIGSPFRKSVGPEQAGAVFVEHFPDDAIGRGVALGAAQAIGAAANYGRNFNENQLSEMLGFPTNSRQLRKEARAAGVSEDAYGELFFNVSYAIGFISQQSNKKGTFYEAWQRRVDGTADAAVTILVLRLRLAAKGKMKYPFFPPTA